MPWNRSDSFCCGGGDLWMDFDEDQRPTRNIPA